MLPVSRHGMFVTEPVPSAIAADVDSVVGAAPAASSTVRLDAVPPDDKIPRAVTLITAPGYHQNAGRLKSFEPPACGLIVAVVAVFKMVPDVVCHGAPVLSSACQDW